MTELFGVRYAGEIAPLALLLIGRDLVNCFREVGVGVRQTAGGVRAQRECDVTPTDIDVRMVLRGLGDAIHQSDGCRKSRTGESPGDLVFHEGPFRFCREKLCDFGLGE